jgi:hypothetical protein
MFQGLPCELPGLLNLTGQGVFRVAGLFSHARHLDLRFHASHEFARGERLGEVIVGAGF